MRRILYLPAAAALSLVAACSSMLPRGQAHTDRPWPSYEAAVQAYEEIRPGHTTFADLRALGLDPRDAPNVKVLSYADILRKLVPASTQIRLDPGIVACLDALDSCQGFEVSQTHVDRQRVGSFLLDFLDFRRETRTTGWNFDMTVLVSRGVVVFKLWSGEPALAESSSTRNPLGPLQGFGSSGLGRF